MNKTVVLASGGMDSFLAWHATGTRPLNIYVDIGHGYNSKERAALEDLEEHVRGFAVERVMGAQIGRRELPSGIIPNRNAYLILAAADYGSEIIMGILDGEINSDKSETFTSLMSRMLTEGNRAQYWNDGGTVYNVHSPLRELTKTQAVARYLSNSGSVGDLLRTVSCYSPDHRQCGACPSCFKRYVAMVNNGIEEPYHADPFVWARGEGVLRKVYDGTYSAARAAEIKEAGGRLFGSA